MAVDTDHAKALVAAAAANAERLERIFELLTRRMTAFVMDAPRNADDLFELEWAVASRATIQQIMRETYLEGIDEIIRDFQEIAEQAETMVGAYAPFAQLNAEVVRQLQQITFNGLETLGQDFANKVADQIYQNTLTTQPFEASVEIIRQSVDADLARYARVALHDGLMDFDRSITMNMSLEAGAERFKYFGPDDEVTRDHCDKYVGKTMTIDEINEAWSGSWSGKREGSPFVVAGGYNCRHRFRPVF